MCYEQHPQSVDWQHPQLMAAPRKNRPNQRETKYNVVCTYCGHERWLTFQSAWKAAKEWTCGQCAKTAAGKLGYAATAAKYGNNFALEFARQWRLNHPTRNEKAVENALIALNLSFEREAKVGHNGVSRAFDFYVWGASEFVIEVDGSYIHSLPGCDENDAIKNRIAAERGLPLLRISDNQLMVAGQIIAQFNDELEFSDTLERLPF